MLLQTIVLNPGKKGKRNMAKKKKKWYGNARRKKRKTTRKRKKAVRRNARKKTTRSRPRKRTSRRSVSRNQGVKRYTLAKGVAPNKPKRRKRYTKRRRKTRARRRNVARNQVYRYQIAPVAANSFARNKGAAAGVMDMIKGTVMSPDFWMNWVAPMGIGFFGSKLAAYQLANLILGDDATKKAKYWDKPYMKAAWQLGSGVAGGAVVGLVSRSREGGIWAAKLIAGSVLASALTLLEQQDTYKKLTGTSGLSGLGADVSDELKRKIAASIRKEIESAEGVAGLRDFVTADNLPTGVEGMGDFVTTEELPHAGDTGISLSQW